MRWRSDAMWAVALILVAALVHIHLARGQDQKPAVPSAASEAAPAKVVTSAPPAGATQPTPAPQEPAELPMNPWFLLGLLLACTVWIAGVNWLNRDALEHMIHRSTWTLAMYGVGILGLVLIHFLHGHFVWVMLGALIVVLAGYIHVRNQEVHPSQHVWTLSHIDRKLGHLLSTLRLIRPTRAAEASKALAHVDLLTHDGKPAEPERGAPVGGDARTLLTLRELIARAVTERASHIHLEHKGQEVLTRLRIDGVLHTFPSYKADRGTKLITCIKVLAGMDTSRRPSAHEGAFGANIYAKHVDLRVVAQPAGYGELVSIRILNRDTDLMKLDKLGMRPDQMQRIKNFMQSPSGLCVVCGPPGSGKTTTLYAALQEIDPRLRSALTVELPIDYRLPSVHQVTFTPRPGVTFASTLRSSLKKETKVIMIGDIRDAETAQIVVQAAASGRLVLAGLQAPDSISGLLRLLELKADPRLTASCLKMVVAQRLVRLLCTECRAPAHLRPEQAQKLGIVPGPNVAIFRARGCLHCHRTGYYGQTGIFEILEITPKIREILIGKPTAESIRQEARRANFISLREDGMKRVAGGLTSIEEVTRVVH